MSWTTQQISPLIANAGVTQNVSISSPSTFTLGGGGSGQAGPGWATVSNTSTGTPLGTSNAASNFSSLFTGDSLPFWLLIGTLLLFYGWEGR